MTSSGNGLTGRGPAAHRRAEYRLGLTRLRRENRQYCWNVRFWKRCCADTTMSRIAYVSLDGAQWSSYNSLPQRQPLANYRRKSVLIAPPGGPCVFRAQFSCRQAH